MQPVPMPQNLQNAMNHLAWMSFIMFYFTLPVLVFFGSLGEGFKQKIAKLKEEAMQQRRDQIPNYRQLPAIERKAQEDLWSAEINRELPKDSQVIWQALKAGIGTGIAAAIVVFILEIIFYRIILP
jgi:hypothetical protein